MPQKKPGLMYIYIGIIAFIIFGVGFLQTVFQRGDIWWTNQNMKIPLVQSGNQLEVYVKETKIDDIIDEKRLFLKSGLEMNELKKDDVKIRFNNIDKVKVAQIPFIVVSSSGCTVGIILLVYGFILLGKKKE